MYKVLIGEIVGKRQFRKSSCWKGNSTIDEIDSRSCSWRADALATLNLRDFAARESGWYGVRHCLRPIVGQNFTTA
jgi:hypothetical protein